MQRVMGLSDRAERQVMAGDEQRAAGAGGAALDDTARRKSVLPVSRQSASEPMNSGFSRWPGVEGNVHRHARHRCL
jgi:hypothetical protein